MADDYVTWGQLMAFHKRTVDDYRKKLDEVKEELSKVDFNGALRRLREIMPELERVAQAMREEDGYNAERARRRASRRDRWGWLLIPGSVMRAAAAAALGVLGGAVLVKLLQ